MYIYSLQINGIRLDLSKSKDIEVLGQLVYGTVEKMDLNKIHVDAYRYMLLLIKAVIGLDTVSSDK